MKKIAIVNVKGGVGKTISSVNIAACLALRGFKVLVVDTDPQTNSTQYLNSYDPNGLSMLDVLLDKDCNIEDVIKVTDISNLHILPSSIKLEYAKDKIMLDTTRNRENRLKKALQAVDDVYDYCIIDCPPALNIITINALVAANEVLVPIKIDQFAIDGLSYLIDAIQQIKEEFNDGLNFKGAFCTLDESTRVNKDVKEQLKALLKDKLLDFSIRKNVAVTESTFVQKPVVLYDHNCNAAKEYVAFTEGVIIND